MKLIILAAGQGTRLRPLTDNIPKCMVEFKKKPIIDHILDAASSCNIDNICIVTGYKQDVLKDHLQSKRIIYYSNPNYEKTNMVDTLFRARDYLDGDIIISYADIVYSDDILQKLINFNEGISVVVDKDWKQLWSLRMNNPLDDAETLKINNNRIIELGRKPSGYGEIDAQYIGLIKISKEVISSVINYYDSLPRGQMYDGKDFENMYMTSFLQLIIDNLMDVVPVEIQGGWYEIDSVQDLKAYTNIDTS